MEYVGKN